MVASDLEVDIPAVLASLIDTWCERREVRALALLLPAYVGNNGLTDGWGAVLDALYDLRSLLSLPPEEGDEIRRLIPTLEAAVHRT